MERVTWKLTLPYVKEMANGNLPFGLGNSDRGSVSNPMDGVAWWAEVHGVARSLTRLS